jgi:hypothetical protein
MNFSVVGMLKLAAQITLALAADLIESVQVRGVFPTIEARETTLAG